MDNAATNLDCEIATTYTELKILESFWVTTPAVCGRHPLRARRGQQPPARRATSFVREGGMGCQLHRSKKLAEYSR